MKKKITILYCWWAPDQVDDGITTDIQERLEESAEERIHSQMAEGMTSGQLLEDVESIHYEGWWEVTTETE